MVNGCLITIDRNLSRCIGALDVSVMFVIKKDQSKMILEKLIYVKNAKKVITLKRN